MPKIEQAIVLAAGEGQRLWPFTALRPKVMIRVANRPILEYVVSALSGCGIRNIAMVVGYRKEQVMDFFGSGQAWGVKISYVIQSQQLGTAHALRQAGELAHDNFLVVPGDNIIGTATIADFLEGPAPSVLVKRHEDISKYGVVLLRNGQVRGIVEKPQEPLSNLVNTGIYLLTRDVFQEIGEETELTTVLQSRLLKNWRLTAVETQGPWLDAVYPWDILHLNQIALASQTSAVAGILESGVTVKGQVWIGKDSRVRAGSYLVGPLTIGENCDIGPHVCLFPATSIGNNSRVLPFTVVRNSILGENVEVGSHSSIEDSILDRSCSLGTHFSASRGQAEVRIDQEHHRVEMGTMVGEGCLIGSNVLMRPGTLVGHHCRIQDLKAIEENIPDQALVV